MITLIIVVLVILGLLVVASVVLGRQSQEVESARDTEYLELDGIWIRYSVIGGGPPVLLIHGWLSSSRVWEGLAGRLAQRFTVYTLDLAGFGESDKPLSGYGVRNGSRLLYAFCAHFGLTRTGVVAHDLGGNMAVKLAADHPDVVGSLILVAVPANEEQIDLPTPLWLATLPLVGPLFYALGRAVRPVRAMWMRPFVSDPEEDLPEEVLEDAAQSTPAAVQKSLSTTRREISGGRLARQARMLKGPMLLVAGEEDQIVDPQAVGTWASIADGAEVALIGGCGHLPMIERTSEFNAHVLAFLTGDARYLDLIERSPKPQVLDEEDDYDEEDHPDERDADGRYKDDEAAPRGEDNTNDRQNDWIERADYDREPNERPIYEDRNHDDRRDRSFEPRSDVDEDDTKAPQPPEDDVPNVVRKRRGRYSRPDIDEREDVSFEDESYGNGSDERRVRPERAEREPSRDDPIPEVPKDLFDWQSGWEEYRPRERRRGRSEDRPRDEDGVDDPPETPRQ